MLIICVQQLPGCLIHKWGEGREKQRGAGDCESPAGCLSLCEKGRELGTECKQTGFQTSLVFPPELGRTKEVFKGPELPPLTAPGKQQQCMPSRETVLAGGTSTSLMENKSLGEPVVLRITLKSPDRTSWLERAVIYITVYPQKSRTLLV